MERNNRLFLLTLLLACWSMAGTLRAVTSEEYYQAGLKLYEAMDYA
jgi:hypothetical protein